MSDDPASTTAHNLPMLLRRAYLALHRRTDAAVAGLGLTADQFVVMRRLAEGHAATQQELVRRTFSDPNTVRAILVRLEAKGWVQRGSHATDRRARSVALTESGRAVFEEAVRRAEPVLRALSDAVAGDEARTLAAQLDRLADALLSGQPKRPDPRDD